MMTLLLPAINTVLPSTLVVMTGSAPTLSGSVIGDCGSGANGARQVKSNA
jgi:hypothetical protein